MTQTRPDAENPAPELTAEQWQGLARLGDMIHGLETGLQGPAGEGAAGGARELAALVTEGDLPRRLRGLMETLGAMQDSGLLDKLRDNAAYLNATLEQVQPLLGDLVEGSRELPWEELREDVAEIRALLDRVRALRRFLEEDLAGPLSGRIAGSAAFWEEEQLDDALPELLRTIGHLHRSGMLARLREVADNLSGAAREVDADSLLADLTKRLGDLPLEQLARLGEGLEAARSASDEDAARLGGVHGLIHLLRDREVQKGLRTLSTLPAYLNGHDLAAGGEAHSPEARAGGR